MTKNLEKKNGGGEWGGGRKGEREGKEAVSWVGRNAIQDLEAYTNIGNL